MLSFKLKYRTLPRRELKNYQQMSLFSIKGIFKNPNSFWLSHSLAIWNPERNVFYASWKELALGIWLLLRSTFEPASERTLSLYDTLWILTYDSIFTSQAIRGSEQCEIQYIPFILCPFYRWYHSWYLKVMDKSLNLMSSLLLVHIMSWSVKKGSG